MMDILQFSKVKSKVQLKSLLLIILLHIHVTTSQEGGFDNSNQPNLNQMEELIQEIKEIKAEYQLMKEKFDQEKRKNSNQDSKIRSLESKNSNQDSKIRTLESKISNQDSKIRSNVEELIKTKNMCHCEEEGKHGVPNDGLISLTEEIFGITGNSNCIERNSHVNKLKGTSSKNVDGWNIDIDLITKTDDFYDRCNDLGDSTDFWAGCCGGRTISTTLYGCGNAKLNVGNCVDFGHNVSVYLDDNLLGIVSENTNSTIFEFGFTHRSVLKINANGAIIKFNNFECTDSLFTCRK